MKKEKILLIIDVQNDFITGPLGTKEAQEVVPRIIEKVQNDWMNDERNNIIFTMDKHDRKDYLNTQEGKLLPIEHCYPWTDGIKLPEKLKQLVEKAIENNPVYRNRLGYGDRKMIYTKDTFGCMELAGYLRDFWYKDNPDKEYEIHICGLCTDICVIANAVLLKNFLPEVKIIVDAKCCAGTTPENHQKALDVMKQLQIFIEED